MSQSKQIIKKFLGLAIFYVLYSVVFPLQSSVANFHEDVGTGPSDGLQNPLKFGNIPDFLEALLEIIIRIGFPFVVLAVIYTGFLFVSARGNEQKLTDAKNAFLWTVVGALIVLAAAAISQLISGTVDEITRGL